MNGIDWIEMGMLRLCSTRRKDFYQSFSMILFDVSRKNTKNKYKNADEISFKCEK